MMAATSILWPAAIHLALIAALYAWLTIERKSAVARGEAETQDYRTYDIEPLRARLISNNLSNQFELPTVFYPLVAVLYLESSASLIMVVLAWIFVLSRIAHTLVHILSPNVVLRGNVFSINFVALGAMWAIFLWRTLL